MMKRSIKFLLLAVIVLIVGTLVFYVYFEHKENVEIEHNALVALYNSTDGDKWIEQTH